MKTCRVCGNSFKLLPKKPGFANVCEACTIADPPEEPELKLATVAWSGKHFPEINTDVDRQTAIRFNRMNSRHGFNASLPFSGSPASPTTWDREKGQ